MSMCSHNGAGCNWNEGSHIPLYNYTSSKMNAIFTTAGESGTFIILFWKGTIIVEPSGAQSGVPIFHIIAISHAEFYHRYGQGRDVEIRH